MPSVGAFSHLLFRHSLPRLGTDQVVQNIVDQGVYFRARQPTQHHVSYNWQEFGFQLLLIAFRGQTAYHHCSRAVPDPD